MQIVYRLLLKGLNGPIGPLALLVAPKPEKPLKPLGLLCALLLGATKPVKPLDLIGVIGAPNPEDALEGDGMLGLIGTIGLLTALGAANPLGSKSRGIVGRLFVLGSLLIVSLSSQLLSFLSPSIYRTLWYLCCLVA